MGQARSDRPVPVVEATINPTRHCTGILEPMWDGCNWHVAAVEQRIGADGQKETLIVDRYLLSTGSLRESVRTALLALRLARRLRLPVH